MLGLGGGEGKNRGRHYSAHVGYFFDFCFPKKIEIMLS